MNTYSQLPFIDINDDVMTMSCVQEWGRSVRYLDQGNEESFAVWWSLKLTKDLYTCENRNLYEKSSRRTTRS